EPPEPDPPAGGRLARAILVPRIRLLPVEQRPRRLELRRDRDLAPLEQESEPSGPEHVDGARHQLGSVRELPRPLGVGRVLARHDERPRRGRPRLEPQRKPRDEAEPATRAAEELAEVVAGDVLDDLAAGARD